MTGEANAEGFSPEEELVLKIFPEAELLGRREKDKKWDEGCDKLNLCKVCKGPLNGWKCTRCVCLFCPEHTKGRRCVKCAKA